MKAAAIPDREAERLAALRDYEILDTAGEGAFDALVNLAALICGTPIALVSLIDAHRQWFKARKGLDVQETARDLAFCAHAILEPAELLVVGDSHVDERFADNPLVVGGPQLRFYAGAPLVTPGGQAVGTVCVIDHVPRELSSTQLDALRAIGRQVVDQLEQRRRARALKEAMAAVAAAREELESVLASAQMLVQIVTPDLRLGFFNRCWRETLDHDGVGSLGLLDVVAPACAAQWEEALARASTGVSVTVQTTLLARSGRRLLVEGTLTPQIESGRVVQTRCVLREVTRERTLEARSHALMESSPVGIYYTDTKGECQYANPRWCELAGITLDQALGRGWVSAVHPDDLPAVGVKWREALAGGTPFSAEFRFLANGRTRWVHSRAVQFLSGAEVVGQIGTVVDIHERIMLETELRTRAALQRAILDAANYSIIATSPGGIIQVFSRGAERLLGYAAEELVGRVTPAILHDAAEVAARAAELTHELGAPVEAGFEAFVARARRCNADEREWTYLSKDGRRVPVLLSVTAMRSDQGEITGFLGVASDISERKKAERFKDEFIATVSHELRTPLTSIRGALGLIAGGVVGELPLTMKPMVDVATNNCERLSRLINDILDLERLEAGQATVPLSDFDLVGLVRQAIAANRPYATTHDVVIDLGTVADVRAYGNEDRVLQVMANLLSNACKFSPARGQVTVHVTRRGATARVSVVDQGPGVPAEFRERVFEKFAQADASDTRVKGGSGLGLSISRGLIQAMGGTIGFDSTPGSGATFYFELLAPGASTDRREERLAPPASQKEVTK
ncbi:hypothetical protein BH11MYX4_BH11MYX4_23070 [soil metagenome]